MKKLEQVWAWLSKPKIYWRIFSLVLAVIFWLLAAGDGSLGEAERIITIPVHVHNLAADLALLEPPEQVQVRIRGLAPVLNLGEEALSASIDLSQAEEGAETHPVKVEGPLGLKIVDITPRWVGVYTERVEEKMFPVTLAFLGLYSPTPLFEITTEPPSVTLFAPGSILGQVDHVVAYVHVEEEPVEGRKSFPVRALDARGKGIDLVQIKPPEIEVLLESKQEADGEKGAEND